ncbi:MAG: SDR family oxidoreductase [Proteobacteria bacterium]|nr:SDR family oxidoreductase [Pseudomonadota bacterium]
MLLSNRLALITGASKGIGLACLNSFITNGATIIANSRDENNLNNAIAGRDKIFPVLGNCAEEAIVDKFFDFSKKQFSKHPDIVIVNAAKGIWGTLLDSDISEWKELIELNIFGSLLLMRKAALSMLAEREKGYQGALDIVVIGSTVGNNIPLQSSLYSASKFAVNSAAESLRRELAPKLIRVTTISPGNTKTDFRKGFKGHLDPEFEKTEGQLGKLITGEDIANSILFTISQPAHVHVHDMRIKTTSQTYP